MIWVNYKTYETGTGDRGLGVAQVCEEVSQETGIPIAVCPQTADLFRLGQQVNIELWAQHVDPITPGRNTGWQLPEAIMHAGASGVLINHSEHPLSDEEVHHTIERCVDVGLQTMVFVDTVEKATAVDAYLPTYIAFEPPELVGGDVSVATAGSDVLAQVVEAVNTATVIAGAGVHAVADVEKCVELGVQGVILASAVMKKTDDPRSLLAELASGFQE